MLKQCFPKVTLFGFFGNLVLGHVTNPPPPPGAPTVPFLCDQVCASILFCTAPVLPKCLFSFLSLPSLEITRHYCLSLSMKHVFYA